MSDAIKVLVVDDEENIRWLFKKALDSDELTVHEASSAEDAIELTAKENYSLIFSDILLGGMNGLEFLQKIKSLNCLTPVVMMTAQDTMNNTIEAMRLGAYDYIGKPFDFDEIHALIRRVLESKHTLSPSETTDTQEDFSVGDMVGKDKKMKALFKTIGKAAMTDLSVLITGESGTGKEMVARAFHFYSKRAQKPYICINCAAITKDLLESELFGHEKGAFTGALDSKVGKFELANGGTLFLDEIGDMELSLQSKILRALQNSTFYRVGGKAPIQVDVRIVAATNQGLESLMEQKLFREDLYHRLNVIHLDLPPLRERLGDVMSLARHFLKKHQSTLSKGEVFFSQEVEDFLKSYHWPGNIRELENTIKRAMALASSGPILMEHLPEKSVSSADHNSSLTWQRLAQETVKRFLDSNLDKNKGHLHETLLRSLEKELILKMLAQHGGNQVVTSQALGMNRNTLKRKMDLLGLGADDKPKTS